MFYLDKQLDILAKRESSIKSRERAVVEREMRVIEKERKLSKAKQEFEELKMGWKLSQESFCRKKQNPLLIPAMTPGPMRSNLKTFIAVHAPFAVQYSRVLWHYTVI
ncbi:unnamed protein product, partial [Allacma fusca]